MVCFFFLFCFWWGFVLFCWGVFCLAGGCCCCGDGLLLFVCLFFWERVFYTFLAETEVFVLWTDIKRKKKLYRILFFAWIFWDHFGAGISAWLQIFSIKITFGRGYFCWSTYGNIMSTDILPSYWTLPSLCQQLFWKPLVFSSDFWVAFLCNLVCHLQ